MKAVRRFGLIIAVLLLGLLIGKLGSLATIVIFLVVPRLVYVMG